MSYKPTPSIQKGLEDFKKEDCLKALELSKGATPYEVAVATIPASELKGKSKGQISTIGRRMVNTGRYLKFSFTKK